MSLDSSEDLNKARERYRQLVEEGSYEIGVSEKIDPSVPPPWFDKVKFERGQKTAQQYFPSLSYASISGLVIGIQVPTFLEPLLVTGKHQNIPKLFTRYLSTVIKIKSWYESDPFQEGSKSYVTVRQVRGMHQHACTMMNARTGREIGKDRLWVSQFQMAMTQAGFFGFLITHTKYCFGHDMSDQDLEDIIYLWRVLGYLMGIEDKYNLCNGNLPETRAYLNLMFKNFVKPQIQEFSNHPYPVGLEVAKGIVKSLRPLQPALRWQILLSYWYEILDVPCSIKLSLFQRSLLAFSRFTFLVTLRVRFLYRLFNWVLLRRFDWVCKSQEAIERCLAAKYPDSRFEPGCPFSVTLDSFTNSEVCLVKSDLNQNEMLNKT